VQASVDFWALNCTTNPNYQCVLLAQNIAISWRDCIDLTLVSTGKIILSTCYSIWSSLDSFQLGSRSKIYFQVFSWISGVRTSLLCYFSGTQQNPRCGLSQCRRWWWWWWWWWYIPRVTEYPTGWIWRQSLELWSVLRQGWWMGAGSAVRHNVCAMLCAPGLTG
jgi:hypothetical protein